jgi:hypothetical protein
MKALSMPEDEKKFEIMDREELIKFLLETVIQITDNNSYAGQIEYSFMHRWQKDSETPPEKAFVRAFVRYGNKDGAQGGFVVLPKLEESKDEADTKEA